MKVLFYASQCFDIILYQPQGQITEYVTKHGIHLTDFSTEEHKKHID